jgi:putative peptide zinc metalloprotease protein
MSATLLSPNWYRVAYLRPRLRAGLQVSRHTVRGEQWLVVTNPMTGTHHRFNQVAWKLVASCDGQRSLDEAWSALVDAAGDTAPTQDEAIAIAGQALSAHILVGDVPPDAASVVRLHDRRVGRTRRQAINPLAFRLPLWNPDTFLDRHLPHLAWLFAPTALRICLALAALSALLALIHAQALAADAQRLLSEPRGLLLTWCAYPVIKALHELAHGFMIKAHGGAVRQMGVSLLLLMPVPYVDASASAVFENKRARAGVAAAGIVVELLLAGLGLGVWLVLEPSLARDAAIAVVLVGGLSTLLVNGNPLLRFDGYHVLCDLAELPNLAQRSRAHWLNLLQRRVLGLPSAQAQGLARGERPWLLAYTPLSWAMRTVLLCVLALALAQAWPAASLVLALAALWLGVAGPLGKGMVWVLRAPELHQRRVRAVATVGSGVAAVLVLAFAAPLPQRSHAPAVVRLPDEAEVRLQAAGFVERFLVPDGATVDAGDAIAVLSNPVLLADVARVHASWQEAEVEHTRLRDTDPRAAAQAGDRVAQFRGELLSLQAQRDALQVRARTGGRITLDSHRNRVGMFLPQGHLLAQVLPDTAPLVRALVGNSDIALVRDNTASATVMLASGGTPLAAQMQGAVPQATFQLPSSALGVAGGGHIAVDPADSKGLTARTPHFQVDLSLPVQVRPPIGTRAMVTFEHGPGSAADWLARQMRVAFLRHFPE